MEAASRPGLVAPPRSTDGPVLTLDRLWRLGLYGLPITAGTLAAYAWAEYHGDHACGYATLHHLRVILVLQYFQRACRA